MKIWYSMVLVCVACILFGCSKPSAKQAQIQVNIDKNQKCAIGKTSCDMNSLSSILRTKYNRSRGNCSVQIVCATNLSAKAFFQACDSATMAGIWNISLQLDGGAGSVDCSRASPSPTGIQKPSYNEVSEIEELSEAEAAALPLIIDVSAKQMSLNGNSFSLSNLGEKLKGKKGNVLVKAKPDSSIKQIYSVLETCEANSLTPLLFSL
jgi:biopolymer transport protein ExbD